VTAKEGWCRGRGVTAHLFTSSARNNEEKMPGEEKKRSIHAVIESPLCREFNDERIVKRLCPRSGHAGLLGSRERKRISAASPSPSLPPSLSRSLAFNPPPLAFGCLRRINGVGDYGEAERIARSAILRLRSWRRPPCNPRPPLFSAAVLPTVA
jgi:hypothetical protein